MATAQTNAKETAAAAKAAAVKKAAEDKAAAAKAEADKKAAAAKAEAEKLAAKAKADADKAAKEAEVAKIKAEKAEAKAKEKAALEAQKAEAKAKKEADRVALKAEKDRLKAERKAQPKAPRIKPWEDIEPGASQRPPRNPSVGHVALELMSSNRGATMEDIQLAIDTATAPGKHNARQLINWMGRELGYGFVMSPSTKKITALAPNPIVKEVKPTTAS